MVVLFCLFGSWVLSDIRYFDHLQSPLQCVSDGIKNLGRQTEPEGGHGVDVQTVLPFRPEQPAVVGVDRYESVG